MGRSSEVVAASPDAGVAFPSPAAQRMRRHRQRRRRGLRCLTVELRETEIDALVGMKLLNAETRQDSYAVKKALYAFLERALRLRP